MKNHRFSLILTISFLILLLGAPVSADIFGHHRSERGSGNIASETREVEPFNRIRLDGSCDLQITVGPEQKVVVRGDDNLLDNVVTEVVGRGTLEIDTRRSYSTRRGMVVEISIPHLDRLTVNGSGDAEITGLNEQDLEIRVSGSGDVDFEGMVGRLELGIQGSGDVSGRGLSSESINIHSRGSGDVELEGQTEELEITCNGSGDVAARRLKAHDVSVEVHGSGDISVFADKSFDGSVYGSGDIDVYGDPEDMNRYVAGSGDIARR